MVLLKLIYFRFNNRNITTTIGLNIKNETSLKALKLRLAYSGNNIGVKVDKICPKKNETINVDPARNMLMPIFLCDRSLVLCLRIKYIGIMNNAVL